MIDPIKFITALGQALSAHALYDPGHPSRDKAMAATADALLSLMDQRDFLTFSFLGGEVVFGPRVLRELKEWEWAARLAAIGVERLEFNAPVSREAVGEFVEMVHARISRSEASGKPTGRGDTSSGATADNSIRWGRISLAGEDLTSRGEVGAAAQVAYSLEEEVEGVEWIHDQVARSEMLPVAEVGAVVRSLAVAMRQEGRLVLPLLELLQFDQLTVAHSCNVAVLAMGVAEFMGFAPREVRAIGVAALLHDVGKVKVSQEVLAKTDPFTDEDRREMERHTVEGARLILTRHRQMDLAAVVAYEHHLRMDGTGYPALRFPREPHFASRVVSVCEQYDAYCTSWPQIPALPAHEALARIEAQAGTLLDADVVKAFVTMMGDAKTQRIPVNRPIVMVDGELPRR